MSTFVSTGALAEDNFGPETIGAYARERADLIEHCKRIRRANSQLRTRHKEFEDDLVLAARAIGGDFGMVCPFGDEHLNLLLGDVSGHSISAALAASRIYTETSAHLQTGAPLGDVLATLNRSVIRKFNSRDGNAINELLALEIGEHISTDGTVISIRQQRGQMGRH